MNFRIGQGFDVHEFVEGRPCVIGGVTFDFAKGLKGHSDADVLLHAICDALLGALALGDLGEHFPDTDSKWKGANSATLLKACYDKIKKENYQLANLDTIVVCEAPKLKGQREVIRQNIAKILDVEVGQISVKATTEEKMGYTGSGQGIKAYATVLLEKQDA